MLASIDDLRMIVKWQFVYIEEGCWSGFANPTVTFEDINNLQKVSLSFFKSDGLPSIEMVLALIFAKLR